MIDIKTTRILFSVDKFVRLVPSCRFTVVSKFFSPPLRSFHFGLFTPGQRNSNLIVHNPGVKRNYHWLFPLLADLRNWITYTCQMENLPQSNFYLRRVYMVLAGHLQSRVYKKKHNLNIHSFKWKVSTQNKETHNLFETMLLLAPPRSSLRPESYEFNTQMPVSQSRSNLQAMWSYQTALVVSVLRKKGVCICANLLQVC